jgi:hypothetical protein
MMLPGLFDTGRPNCSRMPWWASHVLWPCNRFPLRPAGPRLLPTLNLGSNPRPARARLTDKWLVPWPSRSSEPSSCTLHAARWSRPAWRCGPMQGSLLVVGFPGQPLQ